MCTSVSALRLQQCCSVQRICLTPCDDRDFSLMSAPSLPKENLIEFNSYFCKICTHVPALLLQQCGLVPFICLTFTARVYYCIWGKIFSTLKSYANHMTLLCIWSTNMVHAPRMLKLDWSVFEECHLLEGTAYSERSWAINKVNSIPL